MKQSNQYPINSSDNTAVETQGSTASDQKLVLLPRNAPDEKSIWIGVLAKYFDIWAPTYPVNLKEDGTRYTFDFYSASRSKLIKIFTLEEKDTITSYLHLPYAEHIEFILDFHRTDCYQSRYCGECEECQSVYDIAESVDACICYRDGADIHSMLEQDEDGDWDDMPPISY